MRSATFGDFLLQIFFTSNIFYFQQNFNHMAEIFGTTGNDLLFGTPEDDAIDALEGNDDVVSGLEGNDTINGGLGDENIFGGAGDDEIFGGAGTDYLRGGEDNDSIDGGAETDVLIGENGNDRIWGRDGNDLILGDVDDATGIGDDVLYGGGGDDKITGGQGNDSVYGEGDEDILSGGEGDDLVSGGEGDDLVFGAGGDDTVNGDGGDDEISGNTGNDSIDGGEGSDTLIGASTFSPQPGVSELDELTGSQGADVFRLGQISPSGTPAIYYDDGDPATAGTEDYALITDFSTQEGDKIELVGATNDYSLAASPEGLPTGTGIYVNDGTSPELIAIIADLAPDSLSLDNPEQFQGSLPIPEVSVFAEPDTPLSEAESEPGRFVFQLSEPAPEGGLTIYFRAGDDDPFPQSRDVNFDPEANTNIEDISVIPLPDRTSFIAIPEGVTEASFVVTPFIDNFVEPDETISVDLIPQAEYTVDTDARFADFVITEGIPQIEGTEEADDLQETHEAEILSGFAGDDTLAGKRGNDLLLGGYGHDSLQGGGGQDTLTGVDPVGSQPGFNEIDKLTGGHDADLFVLGQASLEGTPAIFYDDGDTATVGTDDYALINDFSTEDGDKIELFGEASDYLLGASPEGLASGTGIYLNDGATPELIAVVKNVLPDTLSLDNSEQFIFAEI